MLLTTLPSVRSIRGGNRSAPPLFVPPCWSCAIAVSERSFIWGRRHLDASTEAARAAERAYCLSVTSKPYCDTFVPNEPQFFRHVAHFEVAIRDKRLWGELATLGVNESSFSTLLAEIESSSVWRVRASSATQPMAAETVRCYGSESAARNKLSGSHDWTTNWWRCLDPVESEWPLPPGPPSALLADGWGLADTIEARLEAGLVTK